MSWKEFFDALLDPGKAEEQAQAREARARLRAQTTGVKCNYSGCQDRFEDYVSLFKHQNVEHGP